MTTMTATTARRGVPASGSSNNNNSRAPSSSYVINIAHEIAELDELLLENHKWWKEEEEEKNQQPEVDAMPDVNDVGSGDEGSRDDEEEDVSAAASLQRWQHFALCELPLWQSKIERCRREVEARRRAVEILCRYPLDDLDDDEAAPHPDPSIQPFPEAHRRAEEEEKLVLRQFVQEHRGSLEDMVTFYRINYPDLVGSVNSPLSALQEILRRPGSAPPPPPAEVGSGSKIDQPPAPLSSTEVKKDEDFVNKDDDVESSWDEVGLSLAHMHGFLEQRLCEEDGRRNDPGGALPLLLLSSSAASVLGGRGYADDDQDTDWAAKLRAWTSLLEPVAILPNPPSSLLQPVILGGSADSESMDFNVRLPKHWNTSAKDLDEAEHRFETVQREWNIRKRRMQRLRAQLMDETTRPPS